MSQAREIKADNSKAMNKRLLILLSACALGSSGCTGLDLPQPFQTKPYTYISGGDQLGRDTLENRVLVAGKKFPIKNRDTNEVLSILGQPQNIQIVEREVAEDWYYVYYKNYVAYVPKKIANLRDRQEGTFIVRFYHDRVIDVVAID